MVKIIGGAAAVQGSPEWLEFRRFRIGASDVSSIEGINPWKTSLQLFEEKVMRETKIPTSAMKRGTELEAKARQWYNDNHNSCGLPVRPVVLQHQYCDWAIASLDGFACLGSMKRACEIKCPGIEAHLMALSGEIPAYYISQLQWQMYIGELDTIDYISFDGETGIVLSVKRDQHHILRLIRFTTSFYNDLIDFKPPEPSDRDIINIDDSEAISQAEEYVHLSSQLKSIENSMETLKNSLISKANHARAVIGPIKLSKIVRKGAIDYDSIPELKNVYLDKYRKSNILSWRIWV